MRRVQVLLDPELDEWVEARARATNTSKSAIVRDALAGQKDAAEAAGVRRVDEFLDYLRAEVWRHVPPEVRRKRMTNEHRERLLGFGPEGY